MEENGQLVQFIYNTEREVIVEKESGWTIYIRGSELLASNSDYAKTYYHYANDEMGSITHIVDDRKILNQYEYDIWGNVISQKETIKNRFKFNGQQLDPITQQYYLRARFYNPVIGRFTQEDTYRGDGLNLYAYCANNPIYYVDPSGNNKNVCKNQLPEKRGIPYNYLSKKKIKELKSKIDNRTITKSEYIHYDWNRRINNRRVRGVKRFWSKERRLLKNGEKGTRNWSDQQKQDILNGKTPYYNEKPIEGHHKYNVADYPQIADDPNNIYPATDNEHLQRWHGGNFQNDTNGQPNNLNFKEEF